MEEKTTVKYCAPDSPENKSIREIKSRYEGPSKREEKLERLKKLDSKVRNLPVIISLCVGVLGALIFGLGLSMVLVWNMTILGCLIGAVGCVPMGLAYKVFLTTYEKQKKKYKDEIIKLSEELLGK